MILDVHLLIQKPIFFNFSIDLFKRSMLFFACEWSACKSRLLYICVYVLKISPKTAPIITLRKIHNCVWEMPGCTWGMRFPPAIKWNYSSTRRLILPNLSLCALYVLSNLDGSRSWGVYTIVFWCCFRLFLGRNFKPWAVSQRQFGKLAFRL